MMITLNLLDKVFSYKEKYTKESHISEILDEVCEQIDFYKIATFSICFNKIDEAFKAPDFKYDFSSIFIELSDFYLFLETNEGVFELFFYELDRKVIFRFENKHLFFKIENSNGIVISDSNSNKIEIDVAINYIRNIFKNLSYILETYFPIAYDFFLSQGYLIDLNLTKIELEEFIGQIKTLGVYTFDENQKCFIDTIEVEVYILKIEENKYESLGFYYDGYEYYVQKKNRDLFEGNEIIAKQKAIDSFNNEKKFLNYPIKHENITCWINDKEW